MNPVAWTFQDPFVANFTGSAACNGNSCKQARCLSVNSRAQNTNNQTRTRDHSINNKVKYRSVIVQTTVKVVLSGDRSSARCPCPQQGFGTG